MISDAVEEKRQESKAKVFISYSRKDMAFADRLEAALKARGFEPLIDRTDIYAFEKWWERIEALIARADTVIFVLSPDAVASDVAVREVAFAASLNKRFAPVVWRKVDDKLIPEALAKLNFIFFDDQPQFEHRADELVEALRTDIGWIRQHTEFGEAARRWALAKGPTGLLLRSPMLEQAERWIAARPSSAPAPTEETQTFIRRSPQAATRRRNVLTGSLAAGLVLALGLAGLAYWQRGIAVEQRSIAQQNEAQAKAERDNATRNFKLAQKTAESLVFDIAQGLRNVQGMSAETMRKILETAKATFEQLTTSAPDDLGLQRSRAAMLNEFADTYATLGDLDQALTTYRACINIMERLIEADSGNTVWQHDLSESYQRVGNVLMEQGKLDEAHDAYAKSLGIIDRLLSTDPNNTEWQRSQSVLGLKLGDLFAVRGKLADAYEAYRNSLAIIQHLVTTAPNNTEWQRDLAVLSVKLGNVLLAQRKLDEGLKLYRDALEIFKRLASDRTSALAQRDLWVCYNKIGDVLVDQGKLDEAVQLYRDALAVVERLLLADRNNTQWLRDLSISYEHVGNARRAQGRLEEALQAYEESLAVSERLALADQNNGQWQADLAIAHFKIASVYERQGRIADAIEQLNKGRQILHALVTAAPQNSSWTQLLTWCEQQIARMEQRQQAGTR